MADWITNPKPTGETSLSCLGHPMRSRILEVVNEHPMSPVEFVRHGFAGKGWNDRQHALSQVSYHFRALEKAGAIEIAETNQRRGATEHVYRGKAVIYFTSEDFEKMSIADRAALTRPAVQGFCARTDSAVATGTFDARPNRHLSWQALVLDQQGFDDLAGLLDETLAKAQNIHEEASARLTTAPDGGIPTTIGLFGYESPELPLRD